jgi:hypothetical protein
MKLINDSEPQMGWEWGKGYYTNIPKSLCCVIIRVLGLKYNVEGMMKGLHRMKLCIKI